MNNTMQISDGVLVIDKPAGLTSHDVVYRVRKELNIKKVGHAGTLDPFATGILILLIGKATKKQMQFMEARKEYVARAFLGAATDTYDCEGKIMEEKQIGIIKTAEIEEALHLFKGAIQQLPPVFSAKKINGKRMYHYARKGIPVKRIPADIFIYRLEIQEITLPEVEFLVECSKGTYLRTLCHDIGKKLGVGAYLKSLRRTRSGQFSIDEAISLDEFRELSRKNLIQERIIPLSNIQ